MKFRKFFYLCFISAASLIGLCTPPWLEYITDVPVPNMLDNMIAGVLTGFICSIIAVAVVDMIPD